MGRARGRALSFALKRKGELSRELPLLVDEQEERLPRSPPVLLSWYVFQHF